MLCQLVCVAGVKVVNVGLSATWIRCCLLERAGSGLESIQPQATDAAQTGFCLMMAVNSSSKCLSLSLSISQSISQLAV